MNPIAPARDVSSGEILKTRAHAALTAYRCPLVRLAQTVLLRVLLERGTATADDVRPLVPVPAGIDPKVFGAVPGPLARAGIIRADGYRKSDRKEARARPNRIWTLADRAAALKWLANYPTPMDETPAASPEIHPSGSNTGEVAP